MQYPDIDVVMLDASTNTPTTRHQGIGELGSGGTGNGGGQRGLRHGWRVRDFPSASQGWQRGVPAGIRAYWVPASAPCPACSEGK